MNCPKCKKSDEVVTRDDGSKYCLDCGEKVDTVQADRAPCAVNIELLYNGDYPGFASIRINDRWATEEENNALVTIFGAIGVKHLYDMVGAERSHEEHKPWVGTLSFHKTLKAQ